MTSGVTVLICAYKESLLDFDAAMLSLIFQTIKPDCFVVVDDSGEDRFKERCLQLKVMYLDELNIGIEYIGNSKNCGLVSSLNIGLAKINTEYVARMDADDISLPYRFETQLKLLRKGYDVVGGGVTTFDELGHVRNIYYPHTNLGVLYSLFRSNPIAHPVSMYKLNVIKDLSGYNDVPYAEDLDLWMRAYLAGAKITNSRSKLLLRRVHSNQLSVQFFSMQKASANSLRKRLVVQFFKKIGCKYFEQ